MTMIAICVLAIVVSGTASAGTGNLRVGCSSNGKHIRLSGIPQTAVDGRLFLWLADGVERNFRLHFIQGHIASIHPYVGVVQASDLSHHRSDEITAIVWFEASRTAVEPLPFRLLTVKAHAACT
jgi:hypothetical protein